MEIKRLTKNKKASHVGFILSFVIFVTSVVFLYTILQPSFQTNFEKQNVLDYLMEELVENATIEYTSVSFNFPNSLNEEICLEFNNLLSTTGIGNQIKVFDSSGNTFNAYTTSSGDNLVIEKGVGDLNFSRVISSTAFESINPLGGECPNPLRSVDYEIGLIRTEESVFSSEILDMINSHRTNYENLKTSLKIPETSDFSINFTYQNKTSVFSSELALDTQINVYSDEKSIQYINAEGLRETGNLQIRVW